jgi:hypothetical protein
LVYIRKEDHHSLLARFAKWTGRDDDQLISPVRDGDEEGRPGVAHARVQARAHQLYSIMEILASAPTQDHISALSKSTALIATRLSAQASLVCTAIHFLVVPLLSTATTAAPP